MKVKKGDNVFVGAGKDRGRKGTVLEVRPKEGRLIVEGINLRKKHVKPKKSGEKGQIVEIPRPFSISNVKIVCPKCGKATRVGYHIEGKEKQRMCKKCGVII